MDKVKFLSRLSKRPSLEHGRLRRGQDLSGEGNTITVEVRQDRSGPLVRSLGHTEGQLGGYAYALYHHAERDVTFFILLDLHFRSLTLNSNATDTIGPREGASQGKLYGCLITIDSHEVGVRVYVNKLASLTFDTIGLEHEILVIDSQQGLLEEGLLRSFFRSFFSLLLSFLSLLFRFIRRFLGSLVVRLLRLQGYGHRAKQGHRNKINDLLHK